jgi:ribosomal protein S18 acetylase RimI-like enzyme
MDDVTIREAIHDDVAAIQRVARESWHAAYDDILGTGTVESVVEDWYETERLRESIARNGGLFLVAVTNEEIIGFAQTATSDDGPAWLYRIYVRPDRWSEGVGSEMLDRIESWLRDTEADRLRLGVIADNEVGNAFYERRGYAVVEEREAELLDATFEEYVREKEL